MKSLIFLAALCVVAATAQDTAPDMVQDIQVYEEILGNVYEDMFNTYTVCFPDLITKFLVEVQQLSASETEKMNSCMRTKSGLLDDTGALQFDSTCQWMHMNMPSVAETLCKYLADCGQIVTQTNQAPKAYDVLACFGYRVMHSCATTMKSEGS